MLHHLRLFVFVVFVTPLAFAFAEASELRDKDMAVSKINGRIELGFRHTSFDLLSFDLNMSYVEGSIAVPIIGNFGAQISAGGMYQLPVRPPWVPAGINLPDVGWVGVGAHLFWRDPNTALVGAYANHILQVGGGADGKTYRIGAEAEVYLNRVSVEAFAGLEINDFWIFGQTEYFAGDLAVAFYATDNLRLNVGVLHFDDIARFHAGSEVLLPVGGNNVAVFASGAFDSNIMMINGGLRLYFGENGKSLIRRHREDGVRERLFRTF